MDKHFIISVISLQKGQFATITTDITAMKQSQDAISAKNKELENYLYVASHDLRSPLVNIQGFSQRLQKQTNSIIQLLSEHPLETDIQQKIEKITGEGIPKSLDFIFTNVSKMDTLINGLLKISRTGRMNMSIQKINMNDLLEKIIRTFSFQIEEAKADIVVEHLPECYGDAVMLNQLFSNIIGNALKYRDKDRPLVITVTAQPRYNNVRYSIQDTGIGIAQRHLEKIWDVFYQVDSQSPEAGEGIGLSIVKRIVDKHKGKIRMESQEGKGSVFYVELSRKEFSE
jgi:signal transduction histidine kinase